MIRRVRSEGDRRRSYVQLRLDDPSSLRPSATARPRSPSPRRAGGRSSAPPTRPGPSSPPPPGTSVSPIPAASAGTHPAAQSIPARSPTAAGTGSDLDASAGPSHLDDVLHGDDLVVAVCDNAHEELTPTCHGCTGRSPTRSARHRRRLRGRLRRHQPPHPATSPPVHDRIRQEHVMTTLHLGHLRPRPAASPSSTAAARLADEFDGIFGTETIERFLHSSYDQFADRATVANFLPLLAERFARQRLQRAGQGRRPAPRRQTHRAVPVHPQRRPLPDGARLLPAPRRRRAPSPGPAAPNPASRSTRPPSRRWPNAASTSPASSPSPGPTRSSAPPTSSSPWAAATPARSSPASATRTGTLDDPAGLDLTAVRPIRDEIERRVRQLLADVGLADRASQPTHAASLLS